MVAFTRLALVLAASGRQSVPAVLLQPGWALRGSGSVHIDK